MTVLDKLEAYGHKNVLCTHNTTIEITKEDYLTEKGNCIIGINSTKACIDLNSELKERINNEEKLMVIFKVEAISDSILGYGSNKLTLLSSKDMVFRKSNFICDRTILINCTKSSNELNRQLIELLRNKEQKIEITFKIYNTDE